MPAEIEWLVRDELAAIRFGPEFFTAANRDPYAGAVLLRPLDKSRCYLFLLVGKVTRQDIYDILTCCLKEGFREATEERNKKMWIYELATFKRRLL